MKKTINNLMILIVIIALGLTACANQEAAPTQDTAPDSPGRFVERGCGGGTSQTHPRREPVVSGARDRGTGHREDR
ncbi:MAG: hypothetical protein MZV70_17870 [Desulfobacterales bacterium]|nr:hypothetical protein [Desulfobacterales bacterium]